MKKYRINYTVMGDYTIAPIYKNVFAESEPQARAIFLSSKDFYNTTDANKVIIVSIRLLR